MTLTRAALEEMEARANAAAPAPWRLGPFKTDILGDSLKGGDFKIADIRGWGYYTGLGNGALGLSHEEGRARQDANATFIAHARQDVPALIAALRAERETVARLRDGLKPFVVQHKRLERQYTCRETITKGQIAPGHASTGLFNVKFEDMRAATRLLADTAPDNTGTGGTEHG